MVPSLSLIFALRVAGLLLVIATVFRLRYLGLHRRYRFFFAYLCVQIVRTTALMFARNQTTYGVMWAVMQPVNWLLNILIVLEIYTLILENYSGLRTIGRWALYTALGLASVFTAATLMPAWRSPGEQYPILFYFAMIQRGLYFSLVVFLMVVVGFVAWYPVPLSRNLLIHCSVYSVYFLSASLAFLARNLLGANVMRSLNTGLLILTCGCYLAWIFLLTRRGETARTAMRFDWRPEDEQRLVDQLTAINSSLLRVVRK